MVATVAKKLYDVARKPENQKRMKQAVETIRSRRAAGTARRAR